jgi:hypothetical protein
MQSNEDLLAYIQTPVGRRFLESAPLPIASAAQPPAAPFNRILWSGQAGLVLAAGGLGLLFVSRRAIEEVVKRNDPYCRGVVMLGLEAPEAELAAAFRMTSAIVKGFAIGRTVFADAARQWLSGKMTDQQAVADMAARFERLVTNWESAHVETARKAAR